ncbi:hyaluronan-binding protein 2 isoform X2 [Xenopus laevis]|uniref:Hyaluronan-binding protein 2 n=2 Tax=Xenopus laevis TaxID=8355 RepID=A0A974HBB1_XENLA|nr:hyaluronan-binding protein 2 isoform X2 [Xenopus laevis]OCT71251.1 hypothetical protein XELAEV_18034230mg [Xenopus laevis]
MNHPRHRSTPDLALGHLDRLLAEDLLSWALRYYDELIDPCAELPCRNDGTCVQTDIGYNCLCTEFYGGKNCEKLIHSCSEHTCQYGDCVLSRISPYYKCRCDYPYYGSTCRSAIVACDGNPCKNGGVCLKRLDNTFRCKCSMNYRGEFCEIGPHDCYKQDGLMYRGHISQTELGFTCLPWDSYLLIQEGIHAFVPGISAYGIGEHNFCRNPDGAEKPWCYFQADNGKLAWDLCDVKSCPRRPPTKSPVQKVPDAVPTVVLKSTENKNVSFSTCGVRDHLLARGRIIGGTRTQPGKHPWLASVQLKIPVPPYPAGHLCGGSLIAECWVLTAAHCVNSLLQVNKWKVLLGRTDLAKNESSEQSFDVDGIFVHENYLEGVSSFHNDIALLKLKKVNGKCAEETRYVKTACLPKQEFKSGKPCMIAGWGETEKGATSQLLEATVQLISEANCSQSKSYGKNIDRSMLCAGVAQGGLDSCQGDSGGPLICERSHVHYIAGVVSWGEGCGVKDKPGVYAHTFRFVQWIQNIMKTK